jgi:hypothetical protein
MKFYLGTHKPMWLEQIGIPMMVSRRTLAPKKRLPVAKGAWVMDSGGFTELSMFGEWRTSVQEYVDDARRIASEVGSLVWAAPQDWMCEPFILNKTGLTVMDHQIRTTDNLIELRMRLPEVRFIPVLQGWEISDYLRHEEMYLNRGIDLYKEETVGIGSVCRRQGTDQILRLIAELGRRMQLHGFGVKTRGVQGLAPILHSSDSMAWSFHARMNAKIEGHTHKNCANCLEYALKWRERLISNIEKERPIQTRFA